MKRREDRLFEEGWFAISEDMWRDTREILPRAKLLADAHFPAWLVRQVRREGIDTKKAQELNLDTLGDDDLLPRAARLGRLLITMDEDFWSERKFPLHRSKGLIVVEPSGRKFEGSDGFYVLIAFLKSFGGRWVAVKVKATCEGLRMRLRSVLGKTIEYEMKIFRGAGAFARVIGPEE